MQEPLGARVPASGGAGAAVWFTRSHDAGNVGLGVRSGAPGDRVARGSRRSGSSRSPRARRPARRVTGAARARSAHGSTTTSSATAARSTTTHGARRYVDPFTVDAATTLALRDHMLDTVGGYVLQPAGRTGTGPSSLAAAAIDAGGGAGASGAAERAALTAAGFRAAYKLLFRAGADRQVLEQAYRFAGAAGAQQYAARVAARRAGRTTTPSGAIPGVPGAHIIDSSEADASAALVLFTCGATLVVLSTIQPPGTDAVRVLAPVASAQYDKLANY